MRSSPLKIAYLYTTFPKSTETFMQREILAMQAAGVDLRIFSMWGGGGDFHGIAVTRFSMWRLLELIWVIPWVALTRWDVFGIIWKGLFTRRAPGWMNFWENMLGAGFAGLFRHEFARNPPDLVHAAWGGAPATAAWMLYRFNGHRYSAAAHAYDIYEHGGDWWLNEKLAEARFVHTSTAMGAAALVARGLPPEKVKVIHRGLAQLPDCHALRAERVPVRIVCIARLVEKKGLPDQLRIYAALRDAGVAFDARIVGEGPYRPRVTALLVELRLEDRVTLCGHGSPAQVTEHLAWADVLFHTGIVAASGDRDGLPNVIPEAMAAGVLVVTSPVAATTEAVRDGVSGLVAAVDQPDAWVAAVRQIIADTAAAERMRIAARAWVETEFDAHRNAARLLALFQEAVK